MSHVWVLERFENDNKWWPFQHGISIDSRKVARSLLKINQEIWPFAKFRVRKYVRERV